MIVDGYAYCGIMGRGFWPCKGHRLYPGARERSDCRPGLKKQASCPSLPARQTRTRQNALPPRGRGDRGVGV